VKAGRTFLWDCKAIFEMIKIHELHGVDSLLFLMQHRWNGTMERRGRPGLIRASNYSQLRLMPDYHQIVVGILETCVSCRKLFEAPADTPIQVSKRLKVDVRPQILVLICQGYVHDEFVHPTVSQSLAHLMSHVYRLANV
jgi:hypothetical protein